MRIASRLEHLPIASKLWENKLEFQKNKLGCSPIARSFWGKKPVFVHGKYAMAKLARLFAFDKSFRENKLVFFLYLGCIIFVCKIYIIKIF
jgi:hypothetical protein